jgi:hypothetical protein
MEDNSHNIMSRSTSSVAAHYSVPKRLFLTLKALSHPDGAWLKRMAAPRCLSRRLSGLPVPAVVLVKPDSGHRRVAGAIKFKDVLWNLHDISCVREARRDDR